jgi:hypothetical protein
MFQVVAGEAPGTHAVIRNDMEPGIMMAGWIWTILLNGTVGLAGYWIARHGFHQPPGHARTLAAATLAWTWVTLGMLVLGTQVWLGRGPLLLWAAVALITAVVLHLRDRRKVESFGQRATPVQFRLSAILALGLFAWSVILLGVPAVICSPAPVGDGPIYHLYFAIRWWKAGRLFLIATPFGDSAATYFPAGGDLWFSWLIIGLRSDHLARVGQFPFLLTAGLAVYAMCRMLSVGSSAALIASLWFMTSHLVLIFSFHANVDTIFVAGYLVAVFFGLRSAIEQRSSGSLFLAALAAGGAWGTKPTSTVFVVPLLALGVWLIITRPGRPLHRLLQLAILLVVPLLVSGYWFGRNAWLTGNPLYPLQVESLGRVWLPGCYDAQAMRQSPFYVPADYWPGLVQILSLILDPRLALLWLGAIAGVWAIGRGGRRPPFDRWVWACSALAVLNVTLFWVFIPYRSQQRFVIHALGLAAVPLGRLLDRRGWVQLLAVALLTVHLITPQTWPIGQSTDPLTWKELLLLSPQGPIWLPYNLSLIRAVFSSLLSVLLCSCKLALGVGCCLGARAWCRLFTDPSTRRWAHATALTAASVASLYVLVYVGFPADLRDFPRHPQFARGWRALDARAGPAGARVAYAGNNLPYHLMGTGLRNDVQYINIDEHTHWLLHDYHRAARARGEGLWPTPLPGWPRLHPNYDAWLANLQVAGIQLLVITREVAVDKEFALDHPPEFPIEETWAETHPETFQPLYGEAEDDLDFRIYRLKPPRKNGSAARRVTYQDGRLGQDSGCRFSSHEKHALDHLTRESDILFVPAIRLTDGS